MTEDLEREKHLAAQSAAELVEDGMRIGLGTGSTVAYLLPILAHQRMRITCVATSPRTEQAARAFGLAIAPFDTLDRLDLTIDGADQITTQGWLIKGGGGAHTREKIVAASSERFVIIADSSKLVDALSPPVPMELLAFGISTTLQRLEPSTIRDTVDGQRSPDGGIIADFLGDIEDPRTLDDRLSCTPGVIDHGIFAPELVTGFFIGSGDMVSITTRSVRP